MSINNSNGTFGNRTRNLPACSAVPQPTAPPRAPMWNAMWRISSRKKLLVHILDSKANMEAAGCSTNLLSLYKEGQLHNAEQQCLSSLPFLRFSLIARNILASHTFQRKITYKGHRYF
jgi:hypothetical protein